VTEEDLQPKPQLVILGSLSEIGSNSLTILTRDEQKEVEVQLTTQTQFENADGETITKSSLFEKLQIIVVGYVDIADKTDETDQDINYATLVRSLAPIEN
jgi:ACT domain-containing protein